MKRGLKSTTLLAMGLLMAGSLAAAQDAPSSSITPAPEAAAEAAAQVAPAGDVTGVTDAAPSRSSLSGGRVSFGGVGRDSIDSSKFTEYRDIPKNAWLPYFNLFSTGPRVDFNLSGYNVRQRDQRYKGWLDTSAVEVAFDYNQIPHDMGNGARTIMSELSPGTWGISDTLQQTLGSAVDATPTTGRTVAFYDQFLGPTFSSAGRLDVSSDRKRGTVAFDFSKKLPFDLTFTYMRELKSGYRGEEGGPLFSAVSPVIEVPSPLDEVTQDFGLRAVKNFKRGNVHASFARNLFNNRAETLVVDNPFQAFDAPYVAAPAPAVGGGSRARFILAPDNEASTGNLGFQLKFARQTRIGGDVSLARWTQNAPFYPYTINSAVLTPAGVRADSLEALQQRSLDGKIDHKTINFTFSSRPVHDLTLRAQFRQQDLTNKTQRFVITGDMSEAPDRSWTVVTPGPEDPFGHATANIYDTKTRRFTASASYDLGPLTLEAQGRTAKLERTSREATSGKDNGFALTALVHARDWLALRGTYDQAKRTAEGETYYGFQSDEAERQTKRTGVHADFTLPKGVDLGLAYFRRNVEYTGRPDRIPMTSGEPTPGGQPFPGTPSGLLYAKYDSYTVDLGYAPSTRLGLAAFYTYEKDRTANQWSTTTGLNLNNLLNYAGTDKTDTYGLNAAFQIKPDVWTLSLNGTRQKVDGLMDITAREAGAFYNPARTTLVPAGTGGAQDINDWDDTKLTTVSAQLDYAVAQAWGLTAGYAYEKYDFRDAYTAGDELMPQAILIFVKSNRGAYDANVFYARINYRF